MDKNISMGCVFGRYHDYSYAVLCNIGEKIGHGYNCDVLIKLSVWRI